MFSALGRLGLTLVDSEERVLMGVLKDPPVCFVSNVQVQTQSDQGCYIYFRIRRGVPVWCSSFRNNRVCVRRVLIFE